MFFADLFDSGFKTRNKDHFASIVRVAMSDGVISEGEKAFLSRLAEKLEISSDEYDEIIEDYMAHPINPPSSYEDRIERLYDLARMVWVDKMETSKQIKMLNRLVVGLGFNSDNTKQITEKALDLVHNGADLDTFIDGIKTVK